ncbi:MAG TPA: hypothetical protein VEG40_10670 [Gaiellaceae bacterium]|nr:hypothetical protein [Gaiellaceae bacterium]HYA08410.1 hypothetical protein [Gaiellaceae bacterium]
MTGELGAQLRGFLAADFTSWSGFPERLTLDELEGVVLAAGVGGRGSLGAERRETRWVAAESRVYERGLRVWTDGDEVVLIQGEHPLDAAGAPAVAPELGRPELTGDTLLGDVTLPGGELVYAARGLTLHVNPGNGLLLGALGFAPTTPELYVARLRPEIPPLRSQLTGGVL